MNQRRDHLEISLHAVKCFLDDGSIDEHELQALLDIAERDGRIDADEIRVLENVIARIRPDELSAPVREKLAHIKARFDAAR